MDHQVLSDHLNRKEVDNLSDKENFKFIFKDTIQRLELKDTATVVYDWHNMIIEDETDLYEQQ